MFLLSAWPIMSRCKNIGMVNNMKYKIMLGMISTLICVSAFALEVEMPRSMPDKGRYFLVEKIISGPNIKTLHKRIGVDSVGYTSLEINCKTKQYKELGYSEESADAAKRQNYISSKWVDLVSGSSKSDLVTFICKKA